MSRHQPNLVPRPLLVGPKRRPRLDDRPRWEPLDDVRAQAELVGLILTGERYGLCRPHLIRGPGAYVLAYTGPHPLYQNLRADVLYAGMSIGDIGERLSSHRTSIEKNPELDLYDVAVVAVPCAQGHFARLAEDLLIGAFDPPWCRPDCRGFGSRPQGSRRPQRSSSYDALFPGRLDRMQV